MMSYIAETKLKFAALRVYSGIYGNDVVISKDLLPGGGKNIAIAFIFEIVSCHNEKVKRFGFCLFVWTIAGHLP